MRPRFPRWWERYVLKPYVHRGKSLETGIDCFELDALVKREVFDLSIDIFGLVHAGELVADAIRSEMGTGWREVPWEEGATALFNIAGEPTHVGVCTARRGLILHAYGPSEDEARARGCAPGGTNMLDFTVAPKWGRRFVGCYLPQEVGPKEACAAQGQLLPS